MTEYEMNNTLVPIKEMSFDRLEEIANEWKKIHNTHVKLYNLMIKSEEHDNILLKKYEEVIGTSWNMWLETNRVIKEKSKE